MDNVVLTSATQISPITGNPLNPQPVPPLASEPETTTTVEALLSNPLEPVGQTDVDGNFQARMDVNYQAHDVALATAKANGHEQSNGFKLGDHHQMEIDDGYEHPDKVKSCCSLLNKLFLALAIVCFALFLCSIAFIVANLEGVSPLKILLLFVCLRSMRDRSRYVLKGFMSSQAIIDVYLVNKEKPFQGQTYFVIGVCVRKIQYLFIIISLSFV